MERGVKLTHKSKPKCYYLAQTNDICEYKCQSSEMCLSNDYICDTIHNCPSGDDEKQKCGKWKVTIDSIDSDVSGDKLY